jgi:hypothetical protein
MTPCEVCGGEGHTTELHQRLGGFGFWHYLAHAGPGLPREVLDEPALEEPTDDED